VLCLSLPACVTVRSLQVEPEDVSADDTTTVCIFEDRQDLLGHRSGRITSHYSAAELTNLILAVNHVVGQGSRKKSRTGDAEKEGG
jgi:hypothetical protein